MMLRFIRTLKYYWYRGRISKHARSNAFHHLPDLKKQAINETLGPPRGGPTDLVTTRPEPDLSREKAAMHEVCQRLSDHWWWPAMPFFILLLLFISWRADTRLFLLTGWPTTDAMLFGFMLTVLVLLATWGLLHVWEMPYDGTSRRTQLLTLAALGYALLICCIVAIRIGQADPNEPWSVRWGSSGLILAATIGPCLWLELLARRFSIVAPLLHRRSYLNKIITTATTSVQLERRERAQHAREEEEYVFLVSRLEDYYDIEYEKYTLRYSVKAE